MHEYEVKIFLDDEEDEALQGAAQNAGKTPAELVLDLAAAAVVAQVQSWLADKLSHCLVRLTKSQAYKALRDLVD